MINDIDFLKTLPKRLWICHGPQSTAQQRLNDQVARLRRMGMIRATPEDGQNASRGFYAALEVTQLARTTYGAQLGRV